MHSGQKIVLSKFNQFLFDNVVLFAPMLDKYTDSILEFTESGGNLLVAIDEEASGSMRSLLASMGVELDKASNIVIDHL